MLTKLTSVGSKLVFSCFVAVIAFAQDAHKGATLSISPSVPTVGSRDPVLVGAGDIASCDDLAGAEATAKLIDGINGTVFAVGDLAYPDGSEEQFANC